MTSTILKRPLAKDTTVEHGEDDDTSRPECTAAIGIHNGFLMAELPSHFLADAREPVASRVVRAHFDKSLQGRGRWEGSPELRFLRQLKKAEHLYIFDVRNYS